MEKIIFFCIAIPILVFIFYLGGSAIMKGLSAKVSNRPNKPEDNSKNANLSANNNQLSKEIFKLNELHQSGALTQEEFEKAKNKLLND
jgi:hypothetical protein